jgi:hypothetical protein
MRISFWRINIKEEKEKSKIKQHAKEQKKKYLTLL